MNYVTDNNNLIYGHAFLQKLKAKCIWTWTILDIKVHVWQIFNLLTRLDKFIRLICLVTGWLFIEIMCFAGCYGYG